MLFPQRFIVPTDTSSAFARSSCDSRAFLRTIRINLLKEQISFQKIKTAYHKPIVFSTAFGEKELFVASVRLQRKMRRTRRIPAKMSPSNTSQNRKQHSEKETFAAFFDKTGAGEIVPYAFRMLSGIFVPIPRQDACRDIDIAPGRRYNILWCFS